MDRVERQSGFTFVEVLVASLILVISISGMLAVFPQALRNTTNSGRAVVLNHLGAEKLEELRATNYDDTDLNAGIHPAQATDASGQKYYPAPGFDDDFSLRWAVSAGPTDGAGNPEPGIKTVVVEATYRVRYTITGEPIMSANSLKAFIGTLVTDDGS